MPHLTRLALALRDGWLHRTMTDFDSSLRATESLSGAQAQCAEHTSAMGAMVDAMNADLDQMSCVGR